MASITARAESGNRDYLANGQPVTSPRGARYGMQTMPNTARDPGFGVRPAQGDNPAEFNRVGREYLAAMMRRYNDPAMAWAAYNAGPGRMDRARSLGSNWLSAMPAETQSYVRRNVRSLGGM